jgi:hypothetical protein
MEVKKYPPATKNNFENNQIKILRSKSKNMYIQQRHAKPNIDKKNYIQQKIPQNNSKNNKNIDKNLLEIKLLKEKNEQLKKVSTQQDIILKELHNNFIHNYNKINELRKKYSKLKKYLQYTMLNDDEFIKEKYEEELAIKAVEQQIMDELCPNPDRMSYEQLLELEEGVGIVNKGLSKDKIDKIPNKPFRKALFDDNIQCIICMDGFNENELVKQLNCGHIFHGDCIDHWLEQQKTCPFCKNECII